MAAPFAQTMAALRQDGARRVAWPLALVVVLLAAWAGWFFGAEIDVVETTPLARIEAEKAARSVQSPVAGKVKASRLELGRSVEAGETLVEIDAEELELQLGVEHARASALEAQLAGFGGEVDAAERALANDERASAAAHGEAAAQRREAEAAARLAEKERLRAERLFGAGQESLKELERANAEVEQRQAAADSRRLALLRRALDEKAAQGDRRGSIERLRREQTALQGELEARRAEADRLRHEISKRIVVAPASGRLASVVTLQPGELLSAGTSVATILADGELEVVAHYAPETALGRIRVGQNARLRLDAFPATQYGTVPARVRTVAQEVRYGRVRVELNLVPGAPPGIALEHGLPGTLEIGIEKASPAALVLRAAGRMLTGSP